MRTVLLLAAAAAVPTLAPRALAQGPCPLHPLETAAGRFDTGLAVDGVRLAARFADMNGAGGVEVWRRDGPTWTPVGTLPATGTPSDGFGFALDLEGDSVLAAAPYAGSPIGGSGELRPYRETPGGWVALPPFRTANPLSHVFGDAFDRAGDVTVARSTTFFFAAPESRLHVFVDAGQGWTEIQEIADPNPPAPGSYSAFGESIAVEGTWLAAGGSAEHGGHAYVWARTLAGYVPVQELVAPGVQSRSYGVQVAVAGDRIAVADPEADPGPQQGGIGAVHLFDHDPATGTFVHSATLRGPALLNVTGFGASLDFDGSRLVASFHVPSAPFLVPREGLAVFHDVGTPIERLDLVVGAASGMDAAVGRTVRLARGEVVTTDRTIPVGNALLLLGDLGRFALGTPGIIACAGAPNSTGRPGRLRLDGCPEVARLDLTASDLPPGVPGILVAGVAGPSLPVGQGTLCIGAPRRADVIAVSAGGTANASALPAALGFAAGDVVRLQLWHRDGGSSNLTEALALELTE